MVWFAFCWVNDRVFYLFLPNATAKQTPRTVRQFYSDPLNFPAAGLTVSLLTSSLTSFNRDPWDKFLIPHARFEPSKCFNSILPTIYNAAQPYLRSNFEEYWLKDRRKRWETKSTLNSIKAAAHRIGRMDDNYIAKLRSAPESSKPQDVTSCQSAIQEINQWLNKQNKCDKTSLWNQICVNQETRLDCCHGIGTEKLPWPGIQVSYSCKRWAGEDKNRSDVEATHEAIAKRHLFQVARAEKSSKCKRAADNKYNSKSPENTRQCKRVMGPVSTFRGNKQKLCQAKCDTVRETRKSKR